VRYKSVKQVFHPKKLIFIKFHSAFQM